jgi:TolB-like protein/Tfp pilus assembly protein PilF
MANPGKYGSGVPPDRPPGADAFRIAGWIVHPSINRMSSGPDTVRLEPKVMQVLAYLARRAGQTVTRDELAGAVWAGTVVGDDAVTNTVIKLRKAFRDDSRSSKIIETIPKRGYRLVATVERLPNEDQQGAPGPSSLDPPLKGAGLKTAPPRIAVLPFRNLSGDPEQEYFSDGITEDIITALAKNRWLSVIARNSVISYKDGSADVRDVAKELGADFLVEGSVRKVGNRVRVTAQLIDALSRTNLWSEGYDGDLEDIFALQDEITGTIAATIEPELGSIEQQRAYRKSPLNLNAWDLYHLGLHHMYRFTKESNAEARRLFRHVIDLDPNFLSAYARLAYCIIVNMVYFDAEPGEQDLNHALDAAKQAVLLDDRDAVAHFALGRAYVVRQQYDAALEELETSISLNPNLAQAHCGLGDALTYSERLDDALRHFDEAIRLSPRDPYRWGFMNYRSIAHLFRGEYEEAAKWAKKALGVPIAQYVANANLVAALGHLDCPEETRAAVEELFRKKPEFSCRFAKKHHLFYIKSEEQKERYVNGLRRAGIPE